jgi:hypothetical protein
MNWRENRMYSATIGSIAIASAARTAFQSLTNWPRNCWVPRVSVAVFRPGAEDERPPQVVTDWDQRQVGHRRDRRSGESGGQSEDREVPGAIDPGRILEIPRKLAEELAQDEHCERQARRPCKLG